MSFTVELRRPDDDPAILRLWKRELPQDWVGYRRWYHGVLLDPRFSNDRCLVARERGQVIGAAIVSTGGGAESHLGVIMVDARHRRRGVGSLLWERIRLECLDHRVQTIVADGIPPYVFIPGVDSVRHEGATAAFQHWGFRPESAVWSMHRDLETEDRLEPFNPLWRRDGLTIGPIPFELRSHLLSMAVTEFGGGWARAARETWLRRSRIPRVLGIYDGNGVYGMVVVGGYGEPLGRLGPIGVRRSLRGGGWGATLLKYTLRYLAAHGARRAFFLHCDDESPAYHMYLRYGFERDRRFCPYRYSTYATAPALRDQV